MNESVKIKKKTLNMSKRQCITPKCWLKKDRLAPQCIFLAAICSQMSQTFERRLTKSRQFLSRTLKCKVEEH